MSAPYAIEARRTHHTPAGAPAGLGPAFRVMQRNLSAAAAAHEAEKYEAFYGCDVRVTDAAGLRVSPVRLVRELAGLAPLNELAAAGFFGT